MVTCTLSLCYRLPLSRSFLQAENSSVNIGDILETKMNGFPPEKVCSSCLLSPCT